MTRAAPARLDPAGRDSVGDEPLANYRGPPDRERHRVSLARVRKRLDEDRTIRIAEQFSGNLLQRRRGRRCESGRVVLKSYESATERKSGLGEPAAALKLAVVVVVDARRRLQDERGAAERQKRVDVFLNQSARESETDRSYIRPPEPCVPDGDG